MSDHLRFAGRPAAEQEAALRTIISGSPLLVVALLRARAMRLNDWCVVSGAIYNTVWNVLTGRPDTTGIKDVDLFYWDDTDLSYEAEDAVIQRGAELFADLPVPVEIRNQARVHLWYEQHFGTPYPPLRSSAEGVDRFASKTHAVSVRLEDDDTLTLHAPYGLDDLFSFRVTPNRMIENRRRTRPRRRASAPSGRRSPSSRGDLRHAHSPAGVALRQVYMRSTETAMPGRTSW